VSFATSNYASAIEPFVSEALRTNWFHRITIYSELDLHPVVLKYCNETASFGRGFGFYIWKPIICRDAMQSLPDNDIFVYLDIGFSFNPSGEARLAEYVATITPPESPGMLVFQMTPNIEIPFEEFNHSKREVFEEFGFEQNHSVYNTGVILAGAFMLRINKPNKALIQKWYEVCISNPNLLLEAPTDPSLVQHPGFKVNRNDQPIFSLLCKKHAFSPVDASEILPELHGSSGVLDMRNCPFWALRRRTSLILRGLNDPIMPK
jgi:hypothetical protein